MVSQTDAPVPSQCPAKAELMLLPPGRSQPILLSLASLVVPCVISQVQTSGLTHYAQPGQVDRAGAGSRLQSRFYRSTGSMDFKARRLEPAYCVIVPSSWKFRGTEEGCECKIGSPRPLGCSC